MWHEDVSIMHHDDERVLPIQPNYDTKVYCVKAGMDLGKTYRCVEFINSLPANSRILIVSTRITFARSQNGVYKRFAFYKENLKVTNKTSNLENKQSQINSTTMKLTHPSLHVNSKTQNKKRGKLIKRKLDEEMPCLKEHLDMLEHNEN